MRCNHTLSFLCKIYLLNVLTARLVRWPAAAQRVAVSVLGWSKNLYDPQNIVLGVSVCELVCL